MFVHPITKEKLIKNSTGDMFPEGSPENKILRSIGGSYNFVTLYNNSNDLSYYDHYYDNINQNINYKLESLWDQKTTYKLLHGKIGDVKGKKMLLLGNGTSLKELLFVSEGACVVYTDLSMNAIMSVKKYYHSKIEKKEYITPEFHAVDALYLPFADEYFDIIYGCAFVHHIQRLDKLFNEIYRCLKPGGKCIFLDDAYSHWWHIAKKTVLRPLQIFSHWRTGISPEDKIATERGGYKEEEIEYIRKNHGFSTMLYQRSEFFEHFLRRGSTKLITPAVSEKIAPWGRYIDKNVLGHKFVDINGFQLVWGFEK